MDQFGFFLVLTGIVGLPWDFLASTFITLGSGTPYTIDDQSRGGGVNERQLMRNANRPEQFTFIIPDAWAYRSVDLQVEKTFRFLGPNQIAFIFQGFNIFSFDNFSWYQGFIPPLPAVNINDGRPSSLLDPGRRLQFGVRYGFRVTEFTEKTSTRRNGVNGDARREQATSG